MELEEALDDDRNGIGPAPSTRSTDDLESALDGLAQLRERLPQIDGVLLARSARAALERRGR
jgi:hypothetical protein